MIAPHDLHSQWCSLKLFARYKIFSGQIEVDRAPNSETILGGE